MFRPKTKRHSINRKALLISINEEKYDSDWMDELIRGGSEEYVLNGESSPKKIIDAYRNMPVFFYYKDTGIVWRGEILKTNGGYPEIGKVIEMRNAMGIDGMRRIGINPPPQIEYLSINQFRILDKLT